MIQLLLNSFIEIVFCECFFFFIKVGKLFLNLAQTPSKKKYLSPKKPALYSERVE